MKRRHSAGADRVYEIDFQAFRSNRTRFRKEDIPYVELTDQRAFTCEYRGRLPSSNACICLDRRVVIPKGTVACLSRLALSSWSGLSSQQRRRLKESRECSVLQDKVPGQVVRSEESFTKLNLPLEGSHQKAVGVYNKNVPNAIEKRLPN